MAKKYNRFLHPHSHFTIRYLAVTKPITYAKRNNVHRIQFSIAAVWIVSLLISVPVVCGINDIGEYDPSVCRSRNATYIISSSVGSFYIPAIALLALYHRIFAIIRRRHKLIDQSNRLLNPDTVGTEIPTIINAQSVNTTVLLHSDKIRDEVDQCEDMVDRNSETAQNKLNNSPDVDLLSYRDTAEFSSNESDFDGPREDIASPELEWFDSPKCSQSCVEPRNIGNTYASRCSSIPQLHFNQVSHKCKGLIKRKYLSADSLKPPVTSKSCSGSSLIQTTSHFANQNPRALSCTTKFNDTDSYSSTPLPQEVDKAKICPNKELFGVEICSPIVTDVESPLNGRCHPCTRHSIALSYGLQPRNNSTRQRSIQYAHTLKCCWNEITSSNQTSSYSNISGSLYSSYAFSDECNNNSVGNRWENADDSYGSNVDIPIVPCRISCTGSVCVESCLCQSYVVGYHCEKCKHVIPVIDMIQRNNHNRERSQFQQTQTKTQNIMKGQGLLWRFKASHSKFWLKSKTRVKRNQQGNQQKCCSSKKGCPTHFICHPRIPKLKTPPMWKSVSFGRPRVFKRPNTMGPLALFDSMQTVERSPIATSNLNGSPKVTGNGTRPVFLENSVSTSPCPEIRLAPKSLNPTVKDKRRVSFWIGRQKMVSNREKKATKTLAIVLGKCMHSKNVKIKIKNA